MAGSRLACLAILLALAGRAACAQPSAGHALDFVITPAIVEAGSPELIRLAAPTATSVDGEWLGHKLQFFRDAHRAWVALAGVDVEQAPAPSHLKIHVVPASGQPVDIDRVIDIQPAPYRTSVLTVSPKFVEPDPEEQKLIAADSAIKAKVFATSAADPLWHGNFRAPVLARPTDSFGTRRTLNGKLASIHKGMDFRARPGTIVRAGNSGVVVLARQLYYEGNCVVIDHGLGLYTLSMHLSRIDVHAGQRVTTGNRLGRSGATGRVTGPHLHWAVRWQNTYLDPAKLLQLNLSAIH